MTADRLFSDAELEPVEVVGYPGGLWRGKCRRCGALLSGYKHAQDEARRSGLAALDGHVCRGQTDLPEGF